MKNGIVYIAFTNRNKRIQHLGKDYYFREAEHSARSIKKMYPDLSITLFTDKDPKIKHIDNVKIVSVGSVRIKQECLYDSPYNNTLYIDTDTEIVGSIIEVFDLMDRFDIAATHDLMRKNPRHSEMWPEYSKVPDGFPEFAGGVILFKRAPVVEDFFKLWQKNFAAWYKLTGEIRDQPSFRVSLWQCKDLHIHTLPSEFNIRTKNYNNIIPRINHRHEMWRKK